MINENIIGYDLVKNVKSCAGYERCGYDKLFVVKRNSKDYLNGLTEVCNNENGAWARLRAKYDDNKYIIWSGEIVAQPDGSDKIRFYWS